MSFFKRIAGRFIYDIDNFGLRFEDSWNRLFKRPPGPKKSHVDEFFDNIPYPTQEEIDEAYRKMYETAEEVARIAPGTFDSPRKAKKGPNIQDLLTSKDKNDGGLRHIAYLDDEDLLDPVKPEKTPKGESEAKTR